MGTTTTDYTWELGIDWDAIPTAGLRYLRHGLVNNKTPAALTPLFMHEGETLDFRIFDVSPSPAGSDANPTIKSFSIIIKNSDFPTVGTTGVLGSPFDRLQLTFEAQGSQHSISFSANPQQTFPVWVPVKMVPVGPPPAVLPPDTLDFLTVMTPGRYLVSFLLQADRVVALGSTLQTANYIFAVDPEMIVEAG